MSEWADTLMRGVRRYGGPHVADAVSRTGSLAEALAGMFGPQADVSDMVDYAGQAGGAAKEGDYGSALANMLLSGASVAGIALPGSVGAIDRMVRGRPSVDAPAAESLASKGPGLYNFPARRERPFDADYPTGARTDDAGNLTHDIDGNPLRGGGRIVGRRVDRGADEAIPPTEFDAIATESVGAPAKASALPDGELGRISVAPGSRLPTAIALSDRLSAGQVPKVYAHELGHAIDQLAGEIPTAGLQRELDRVYNAGISGVHRARNLTGPQHVGYKGDDIPRELMAEAIRAYMTNPTYMKTEARKTAAAIRKAANRDPMVNRIIQFNVLPYLAPGSLAAALAAGAYGAGGSGPAEDM